RRDRYRRLQLRRDRTFDLLRMDGALDVLAATSARSRSRRQQARAVASRRENRRLGAGPDGGDQSSGGPLSTASPSYIAPRSPTRLTALCLRDEHNRHANPARMLSPANVLRNVRPSRVQIVPKRGHRAEALIVVMVEDRRVRQKERPLDPRPR